MISSVRGRLCRSSSGQRGDAEGDAPGRARPANRLSQILKELQRHRFGRRAETLPINQLGLTAVQQVEAAEAADTEVKDPAARVLRAGQRRAHRGSLPTHLPRFEQVIEPESLACPYCSGALHRIGEDVSERIDIVPAQIRVLVTRRPKYACRACEEGAVQSPALARLIESGLPTEATGPRRCLQVRLPPASLPAGADLRLPGGDAGPLHPGQLDRARGMDAAAIARAAAGAAEGLGTSASPTRPPRPCWTQAAAEPNRPALGLRARGPTLERARAARRGVHLYP